MEIKSKEATQAEGDALWQELLEVYLKCVKFNRECENSGTRHQSVRSAVQSMNTCRVLYAPRHAMLQQIKQNEKKQADKLRAILKQKQAKKQAAKDASVKKETKKAAPKAEAKEKTQPAKSQEQKPAKNKEQEKPLDTMSVAELREIASNLKIKNYRKLKKDELLKAIREKK